jgi:hypothetical protein
MGSSAAQPCHKDATNGMIYVDESTRGTTQLVQSAGTCGFFLAYNTDTTQRKLHDQRQHTTTPIYTSSISCRHQKSYYIKSDYTNLNVNIKLYDFIKLQANISKVYIHVVFATAVER